MRGVKVEGWCGGDPGDVMSIKCWGLEPGEDLRCLTEQMSSFSIQTWGKETC